MQAYRILQSQGLGSRRDCRELIRRQQVRFDGVLVTDPEQAFACENLAFSVGAQPYRYRENAYLALHKPAGYECSRQPRDHPSVFSLLPESLLRRGVQCVGRLDQDTTGLLLFSDDGHFIHEHTSPKKQIGKTYRVTCKHPVTPDLIEQLQTGVQLHDEPAPIRARHSRALSEHQLELVIDEGKYHQVKRMIAAAGNRVDSLHRSAVGGYVLPDDLPAGAWKWLEAEELAALKTRLENALPHSSQS
ncbi:MAG: 16S rRNA pseudouridine(516) synthase [Hydrogenophilales bacterium 28-61-23]|nr:MAG: 16S rRNA pseudouridine(516) synthase [Hydrogenophilales bacterium 28-61-23]